MATEHEPPTFADRAALWASIDFPPLSWTHPAVDAYVEDLSSRYRRVLFRSFTIPRHPVLDWYWTRGLHDSGFFEKFWSVPSPSRHFPPADPELNYFRHAGSGTVFSDSTPFHLAGDLAFILFRGGAYSSSKGRGVPSMRLGQEAADELTGGDYEGTLCYHAECRWSDFFEDVAWDHTVIVISEPLRRIHCLLVTDTD